MNSRLQSGRFLTVSTLTHTVRLPAFSFFARRSHEFLRMDRNLLSASILGGFLIVTLCFYEGMYLKDRWGEPGAEAEEMGKRFKSVPKDIGNGEWIGQDMPVDEQNRKTAGAVKYVSRHYRNEKSGREVRLWLIVGHSRDICRHTPNVCYPNAGFRQESPQIRYEVPMEGKDPAQFFTAKFIKENALGRVAERVFWAWNHPDTNKWEAPENPRFHYGLSRALYKVYFTSNVQANEKTVDDNLAAEFAKVMLPEIDKALFPEAGANTSTTEEAVEPAAEEVATVEATESPAEEAAPAEEPAAAE